MKRNESVVKIEEQIYCSIFGVICKKYSIDNVMHYIEIVNSELIETIKRKL